jgi:hypothetical protein
MDSILFVGLFQTVRNGDDLFDAYVCNGEVGRIEDLHFKMRPMVCRNPKTKTWVDDLKQALQAWLTS